MSHLLIYEDNEYHARSFLLCKRITSVNIYLHFYFYKTVHRIKNVPIRKYSERNLTDHVTKSTNRGAANRLRCPLV